MRIGRSTIPRMRVPALLKGQMIQLDLGRLQEQWGIVCSLPPFEFADAVFLNQYHRTINKEGAVLLGMLPWADPILDPNLPKAKALGIPLLADPLQRLHRTLGLSGRPSSNRCQSFIFDSQGVIRYHLVHQLNWRGLSFLVEILKHCQDQYSPSNRPPIGFRVAVNTPVSPGPQKARTLSTLMRTSLLDHEGGPCYATDSTS